MMPAAGLDDESVEDICGLGLEAFQQGDQLAVQISGPLAADPGFHSLQRLLKPFPVEGLQQVIDGADLEGPQRILVISGHENSARHALGTNGFEDSKAVQPRHLDIKKKEMRLVALYRRHGRASPLAHSPAISISESP